MLTASHCPSGTTEGDSDVDCLTCSSGSDSSAGNGTCSACGVGHFSPGDSFQRLLDRRQIVEWPLDSGTTVRVSNKQITKTGDSINGNFFLDYSTEQGGYPAWWLFSPGQSATGTHFANNQYDIWSYQKYVGSSYNTFDGLESTDYECEWVSIEFPKYFRVTHSKFIARGGYSHRLPGTFRVYARNATHSAQPHGSHPWWYRVHDQTKRLDSGGDVFEYHNPGWYNEYALCVGALYSYDFGTTGDSSAHVLNFVRWKFYGQVDVDGGSMTPLYWNKFAEYDAERGVVPDMMRKYEKPVNFPDQGDTDNYFRKHVWQLAASDISLIAQQQTWVTWTMTGQPYLNGRYEARASSKYYNWPAEHRRMPWGVWVYLEGTDTDVDYVGGVWKNSQYSTTFTGNSDVNLGDSSYSGDWVTIRFPEPVKASCMQFRMRIHSTYGNRAPSLFRIVARNRVPNQAWQDGWETVHEQTTELSYSNYIGRFDFNRPTDFYEEYGLVVRAVRSGGTLLNFQHAHFYQPGKTCLVARSGHEVVKGGGKTFPAVLEDNDGIDFEDSYDAATKVWTNEFVLKVQPYMNGRYRVQYRGESAIGWAPPSKMFFNAVERNWATYACCRTDPSCSTSCAYSYDYVGGEWDPTTSPYSTSTAEYTGTGGCEVDAEYCGAWMTVSLPTRFRMESHNFVVRADQYYARSPGIYRIYCRSTWSEEEPWKVMVDARRLHQWVGTTYALQPVAVDKPRFCAQIALVVSEVYSANGYSNRANARYWTWWGEPEKSDMDLLPPTTIDALNEDWLTQFQHGGRQWNIPLSGFHESIDGEFIFKGSRDAYGYNSLPERVAYCAYLDCRKTAGTLITNQYLGGGSQYDATTLLYTGDDELTGEFSGGEWTSVRFPSGGVKVMKLTVVRSGWTYWSPTLFYFVGRNDSTTDWTLVHHQTTELGWSVTENKIWVDFPNVYQEYAFVCLKFKGPNTNGRCGYRLKFFGQLGEPTVRVRSMAGFGAGGSVVDALFGTHAVGLATWPYATDQMFWPLNSVQPTYTLCASARYTSNVAVFNHRIIGATHPANLVLGHLNNGYARVYSTAFLDSNSEAASDVKDNWLVLCGIGGKAPPYNVITEQSMTGTDNVLWNSNAQLAINAYNEANLGHWAVHEVIVFDHQLTSTEAKSVTAFLRNELQRGGEECSTCPAGTDSNAGNDGCMGCSTGRVSVGGEDCRLCGSGTIPSSDKGACFFCGPGLYSTANGCNLCSAHKHVEGWLTTIESNLTMHLPFDIGVAARPESKVPRPAIWLKFDDVGDPGKDSSGNGRHGFTNGFHRLSKNRGNLFYNYRLGGKNSHLPNITTSDRRDGLGAARFIPGNWVTLPPFEPRGGGFSVSFWFKSEVRDTLGAHTLVEMREHMGAYTGRLYLGRKDDAQGFWVYRRTADDTDWHTAGEVPPYENGAWTFAGVTWRSDGNAFLMLNSTWYAIGNCGGGAAPLYRHFEIGRFLNTQGSPDYVAILDENYWDGLVDDFRVFDVELGAEDFHAIRLEASPGESFDRLRSADEAVAGVDFPNDQGENPTMMTRTSEEKSLEYLAPYVYIYAPMTSSIKDESQHAVAVADTTKVPKSFAETDVPGVHAAVFSGSQYVEFGEPGNPARDSISIPKVITGPDQSFSFWFKRDAFRSEILFHVSTYQNQANNLLKLAVVGGSLQLQYSDCWNNYRTQNVCGDVWSVDAGTSGMQWHHIVITRSRVGRVVIHCDGHEDYAASWDLDCGGNPAYFYVFVIGAQKTVNQNAFSSYFQGQIRDFMYFTTTLDWTDVNRLYKQGSNYDQFRRIQDRRFPVVTDQLLMSGEFRLDSSGSQDSQARPECVWFGCADNYASNRFSRWTKSPYPYDSSGVFIPGSGMELGGYEGEWVSLRAPYRFKIRSMVITQRPGNVNPPPGSWVLLARNGLEDWVVLYEQRERIDRGAYSSYDWVDTESHIPLERQSYYEEYGVVMLTLQASSNTGNIRPNVRRIYFTGATLRDGEKFLLADSSVTSIPGKELLSRGGGDGRLDFAALRGVKGLTVSLWARVLVSQLRFPSPPVLAFRDFKNGESLLLRDSVQDGFQLVVSVGDVAVKLCAGCLLQTSSKVSIFKCWGRNTWGELGLGDIVHRGNAAGQMGSALPYVQLANQDIDPVVEISGQYSKCALRLSGTIECWGRGSYGALGSGSTTSVRDAASPQRVDLGTGRVARQIVSGFYHHCALLRENAHIVRWPPAGSVVDSSGALQGSLTISNAGSMSGDYGVAWTSVYSNNVALPHLLFHPWDGTAHWASGEYTGGIYQKSADLTGTGYLGDGLSISLPRAFKMTNFKFRARNAIHQKRLPGLFKIFGRNKDSDAWQVIHDQSQSSLALLGSGDLLYIAARISEPRYWMQYAFVVAELYGSNTIMNFDSWEWEGLPDAGVVCWGHGDRGQIGNHIFNSLGNDPDEMGDNLIPVVGLPGDIASIFATGYSTCAILRYSGEVFCWGEGSTYRELGIGEAGNKNTATTAALLGTSFRAQFGHGSNRHWCVVDQFGRAKCIGRNDKGQCGLGYTSSAVGLSTSELGDNLPFVKFAGSSARVVQLGSGDQEMIALLSDGTVWVWGDTNGGSSGQGNGVSQHSPVQVAVSSQIQVKSLDSSRLNQNSFCVLLENLQVKCWGDGFYGATGIGSTADIGDQANEMDEFLPVVDLDFRLHGDGVETTVVGLGHGEHISFQLREDGSILHGDSDLLLRIDFEGAGGDSTGNVATTLTNVATTTLDKRMGQRAGKFDGVSSKISLNAPLRLSKDITFSVWFKEEGPQIAWAKIFVLYTSASSSASNNRILLSKNGNLNEYLFEMRRASSVKQWKFDVESGEWHFFCISLRADGTWVIFHNGEVVVLENYYAPDTSLSYGAVMLGVHAFSGNHPFLGLIDHFTVHSRALSPAEMSDLYVEGQTLGHVRRFDEARDWEVSVAEDAGQSSLNDGLVLDVSFDDGTLNSRVAVPSFPTGVRKDMGSHGSITVDDIDTTLNRVVLPDGRTVQWSPNPHTSWYSDFTKNGPVCVFLDTHCDSATYYAHWTYNAYVNTIYTGSDSLDGSYFGNWVSVLYPYELRVTRIEIQGRDTSQIYRAPGKFRLYARHGAGSDWNVIVERKDKSKAYDSNLLLQLDVHSETFYSEFALVVNEIQGPTGTNSMNWRKLFLHGHRKYGSANDKLVSSIPGYSIVGPGREGEKYFESVGGVLTAGDDENPILPPDALGLSVSMWLHATAHNSLYYWPVVFSKPFTSDNCYMWLYSFIEPSSKSNYVYLNATDQNTRQLVCTTSHSQQSYQQQFHSEKWYHHTITWDFVSGTLGKYVNGVRVQTCTGAEIVPSYLGWSSVVFLGWQLSSGSTGNTFPAGTKVDELKVWSRALSEAEVGLVCPPELRSLVLSLPFDRPDDLVRDMHRDLLFYLPLDGDLSDHSGNEKTDPLNSANLPSLTGSEGSTVTEKAAYFDGTSKCIELPGFTQPSAGLAVVYWFKPWQRGGNLDIIVHFIDEAGPGINWLMIQQTSTSVDTLRVRLKCFGYEKNMFAIPYTINAWQHHVFQWNPDGTTKFYVDGVLHSSSSTNGYCGPSSSMLYHSHRLGCYSNGANYYHFPAYVDEYRVYKKSLTDEEVYALYLHRLGRANADIRDHSGYGRTATPYNILYSSDLSYQSVDRSVPTRDIVGGFARVDKQPFNAQYGTLNLQSLVSNGGFSISLWFHKEYDEYNSKMFTVGTSSTARLEIISCCGGGSGNYRLTVNTYSGNGAETGGNIIDANSELYGKWHHVVISVAADNLVTTYLNGQYINSHTPANGMPSGELGFYVGSTSTDTYHKKTTQSWKDWRVFERALDEDDVRRLYSRVQFTDARPLGRGTDGTQVVKFDELRVYQDGEVREEEMELLAAYGSASGVVCQSCEAGTEGLSGSDGCRGCGPGEISFAGAQCTPCPPGSYTEDGKTCLACEGAVSPDGTSCTGCNDGYVITAGGCEACSSGTESNADWTNCIPCPPYAASGTGEMCQPCPPNQGPNAGQSACVSCPAGTKSVEVNAGGSTVFSTEDETGFICVDCNAGSYSAGGSTSCSSCATGKISVAGSSSCTACSAGTESNSARTGCVACPSHEYSTTGSMCATCATGKEPNAGKTGCVNCPAGEYSSSATGFLCSPCAIGTFSGTGAASCTACDPGQVAAAGSSSCSTCSAGTYHATGAASTCDTCAIGTFSGTGASSCTPCDPGQVAAAGSSSCTDCTAGKYHATGAASSCLTCAAGERSALATKSTSCVDCTSGTFSSQGSSVCSTCVANTYSGPKAATCTFCDANQFSLEGASICLLCPAGTSSLSGNDCESCSTGSFSSAGTECSSCFAGFYSVSGSGWCESCAAGSYSTDQANTCTSCADFTHRSKDMDVARINDLTTTDPNLKIHLDFEDCSMGLNDGLELYLPFDSDFNDYSGNGVVVTEVGNGDLFITNSGSMMVGTGRLSSPVWSTSNANGLKTSFLAVPSNIAAITISTFLTTYDLDHLSGSGSPFLSMYNDNLNSLITVFPSGTSLASNVRERGVSAYSYYANFLQDYETFHLVITVYEDGRVFIFKNGVLFDSSSRPSFTLEDSYFFYVQSYGNGWNDHHTDMDDFRVYFRELSSQEILALYEYTSCGRTLLLENQVVGVGAASFITSDHVQVQRNAAVGRYSIKQGSGDEGIVLPITDISSVAGVTASAWISFAKDRGPLGGGVGYYHLQFRDASGVAKAEMRIYSQGNGLRAGLSWPETRCTRTEPPPTSCWATRDYNFGTSGSLGEMPWTLATIRVKFTSSQLIEFDFFVNGGNKMYQKRDLEFAPSYSLVSMRAALFEYGLTTTTGVGAHKNSSLDDFMLWDRLLSDEEIASLYEGHGPCVNCEPGSEAEADHESCAVCGPGTISDGASACSACAESRTPNADHTACEFCPDGQTSVLDGLCVNCAAGTDREGTETACQDCPMGFVSVSGGLCTVCGPGEYTVDHISPCLVCGPGSYSTVPTDSCSTCSIGFYRDATMAGPCEPCPAGTTNNSDSTGCISCPDGDYSPEGGSCVDCLSEQVTFDNVVCHACWAGTEVNSAQNNCVECDPGYVSSDGLGCDPCASGTSSNSNHSVCESCPEGWVSQAGSVCLQCSAGTYSQASREAPCISCGAGSFSGVDGATSCVSCGQGEVSGPEASSCSTCQPGTFTTSNVAPCENCAAGTYSEAGASSCVDCAVGFFRPLSTSGPCQACAAGEESVSPFTGCQACAAGSISTGEGGACTPCSAGEFTTDNVECKPCPAGSFTSVAGSSECQPCADGYFKPLASNQPCVATPAGEENSADFTQSVPCADGSVSYVGEMCIPCGGPGYSADKTAPCDSCGPGQQPASDRMSCTECADGYISPDGVACLACPAGREDVGEVCVKCTQGRIAALGGQRCQKCSAGRESDEENRSCRKCARRKFSTEGGMCQACGALESSEEGSGECYPVFRVVVRDNDSFNVSQSKIKKAPPRGANFLSFESGEVAVEVAGLSQEAVDFSLAVWIFLSSEVNQSAPVLRLGDYRVRVEGVSLLRLVGFGDEIEFETVPDTWTHLAVSYNPNLGQGAYYVNGTKNLIGEAQVGGRRLLQAPATTEDFSCDAALLMRFSGTDASQPGLNSVTGLDTSYGNVAVVDGALSFTGGGITLPSFEVFEGDSLTITFWMKPIAQATTENIFRLGTLSSEQSPIHFYRSKNGPLWYLISQTEGGTYTTLTIPQDGNTWTFISWSVRADGFWSVHMNDVVAFEGQELRIKPQIYDGNYHQIAGGTNYYNGGLRDFRIYRSYLSDEQVSNVRAGGPATACEASSGNSSSLLIGGDPDSNEFFEGAVDDVRLYEVQLSDGDVAVLSLTAESEVAVLNPTNLSTQCIHEVNIVYQTPFSNIDYMANVGAFGIEYFGNFDGEYFLNYESDPPRHQCAVLKNGSLGCWGSNEFNQTGLGVIDVGDGLQEVCVGAHHTCYLRAYSVSCFGSNLFNQSTVPSDLPAVRSLACGSRFTCALLLSNDEVRCWGNTANSSVSVAVTPNASVCGAPRRVYGEARLLIAGGAEAITSTNIPETLAPLLSDFFFQIAGIGGGYVEVVPQFLESGALDFVQVRLFDDAEQGLAYVDLDVTTSSLQSYMTQVQSEYTSSEVLFFNFTTRGAVLQAGTNELHSYADSFIGLQIDAINVSSVNNLDLRIDSAISFNFLTVSEGAEQKYREILSLVSGGEGFDIGLDGEVQTMVPRLAENGISCMEITDVSTHSLSDYSCIWRYLVLNHSVTSVGNESLRLYKGGEDPAVVKTWIIENSLGSVNEFTSATVEEYFLRACNRALADNANEYSLVCGFFDPGYRWISRVSGGGLDPYTLSDKTVLVLLASLKDRISGQVVRRRLLAVDPRSASRKESGFGFEFTQVNPKVNLATLSNARKKWQYVGMQVRMAGFIEEGVFLANARLVLSSVRRKLGSSIESIQIVSNELSVHGSSSSPSRRLLGHDTWANLTTIFKLENFETYVYKDLLQCLFFELSGNATLLSWEAAQGMVEVCSAAQEGATNLTDVIKITLQDCGGSNQEFEEVECMRLAGRLYRHFTPTAINWYYIRAHFPHSSFEVRHGLLGNTTSVLMDYIREHTAFIFSVSPSRVVAQRYTVNSTMVWIYGDERLPYAKSSPLYTTTDLDALWRGKLPDLLEAFSSLPELYFEGFDSAIRFGGPSPFVPVARDDYFVTFTLRIPFTQLSYRQAVAFEKSAITVLSREVGMSPYDIYLLSSSTYSWHTLHDYKLVFATAREAEDVFQMLSNAQTQLQDAIVKESEAYLPSTQITNIQQSVELVDNYTVASGSGSLTFVVFLVCAFVILFVIWLNLFHSYKIAVKERHIFESIDSKFAMQTRLDIKME